MNSCNLVEFIPYPLLSSCDASVNRDWNYTPVSLRLVTPQLNTQTSDHEQWPCASHSKSCGSKH